MLAFYKADDGKSGVFVGKNTRGQMLIEVEGSGEIAAYPKEELTVAAPYTVKIKKLLTPEELRRYLDTNAFARDMVDIGDVSEVTILGKKYTVHDWP